MLEWCSNVNTQNLSHHENKHNSKLIIALHDGLNHASFLTLPISVVKVSLQWTKWSDNGSCDGSNCDQICSVFECWLKNKQFQCSFDLAQDLLKVTLPVAKLNACAWDGDSEDSTLETEMWRAMWSIEKCHGACSLLCVLMEKIGKNPKMWGSHDPWQCWTLTNQCLNFTTFQTGTLPQIVGMGCWQPVTYRSLTGHLSATHWSPTVTQSVWWYFPAVWVCESV